MFIIESTGHQHAQTINYLAREGLIFPVEFTSPTDGIRRVANSMWAATDWLNANGGYSIPGKPPIWHNL